ncbi:hypothetical protein LI012_16175 [Caldibacillus thermoamylovorans]|uniref:hypothetical protein n=1 Tax=Caldibacillus thermoamylovorans TaxID=35841 RepID=UPI001D08A02D|nr:hypothetical protein [Caldibacillus thermoamylovorans]MCB5936773.1 hypothetical protein [Bacillus sp. DFI.2.34]MCB7078325.1 hypothetical protein [Caldibacillus thermoamylovorans]
MELEKQAELYEKNAQSDIVKEIFTQMLKGDNPFENLAVGLNEFERIKKLKWHQIKVKVMVSINVILNEEKNRHLKYEESFFKLIVFQYLY